MTEPAPLRVAPAPGRIVVRPFDILQANSKLVLPETAHSGKTTTGLVVAINPRTLADGLPDDFQADTFIKIGQQVIFPAFAGTDILMNEPQPDKPRHQQRYVVIRESDVIAAIELVDGASAVEVHAEPRSIG